MRPKCAIHGRCAAALPTARGFLLGGVAMPANVHAEPRRLTLDDALTTAKKTYPGLRARHAERTAAGAEVGEATSGYLPRVNTHAQYQTAREKLRLAEGRQNAGAGSVLELKDAQVAHSGARLGSVQARYDLGVARAPLKRAVGV